MSTSAVSIYAYSCKHIIVCNNIGLRCSMLVVTFTSTLLSRHVVERPYTREYT